LSDVIGQALCNSQIGKHLLSPPGRTVSVTFRPAKYAMVPFD
jgi:hypothetical protein